MMRNGDEGVRLFSEVLTDKTEGNGQKFKRKNPNQITKQEI